MYLTKLRTSVTITEKKKLIASDRNIDFSEYSLMYAYTRDSPKIGCEDDEDTEASFL